MEVMCPWSSSSAWRGPLSGSLTPSSNNAAPSHAPKTSGWPVFQCSKTQSFGFCHIRSNVVPNTVLRQIPRRFSGGVARGEDFGNTGWRRTMSLPLLPGGRFRVWDTSHGWFGPKKGRPMSRTSLPFVCRLKFRSEEDVEEDEKPEIGLDEEGVQLARGAGQFACWAVTVIYVGWLFLLPYAPGDPVWAITPSTIQMLIDQSLNFFFVLPLASMLTNAAGFHGLTAPVLHPTSEALFNFVIGWTLLFAPLLFTDKKRDRFGGSLETLWIIQMFLTNTVLAPYMAIRENTSPANKVETSMPQKKTLPLGISLKSISRGMTSGAYVVGLTGALVGIVSVLWAFIGRPDAGFGGFVERWEYFLNYVGSERLAYAFVWDIVLYSFFQPWLIGDNLGNVIVGRRETVRVLRFVPYLGLVAYVVGLYKQEKPKAY